MTYSGSENGLIELDARGNVVACNDAAALALGARRDDAIGSPLAQLFAPEGDADEIRLRHRLAAIVESSEDAIFSGSLDGTIESWNRGAERLYGYRADEMIGQSVTRLLPTGGFGEVADIRERLLAGEAVRGVELQDRRKDGELIDVSISLSPLRDAEGEPAGVFAIARDISERKQAERRLAESQRRFAGAFENAPIGMALVSPAGAFLAVNRCLCDLVARSPEELMATDFQSITHPDDLHADLEQLQRLLAGELDSYEMEKRYLRPDGEAVWGLLRVVLVRGSDGEPAYFVSQILDITDRKANEEDVIRSAHRLQQLAVRDPLTGLRNLPDLRAALVTEISRARRYDRRLGVAVFDVEGFSHINRTQGREYGDRVLRAVAQLLEGASREPDLAARIGDDSFALILPETDAAGAAVVAERIASHLQALEHLDASVAFGTSGFPSDGDAAEDLLSAAERNLAERMGMPAHSRGRTEPGLSGSTASTVRQVLRLARDQLSVDVAFLSQVVNGSQIFRAVEGDGRSFADLVPGTEFPIDRTICARMIDGRIPGVVADAANEPELRDLDVIEKAQVGAYVGVPVQIGDGEVYGTLCGLSHSRRQDLTETDLDLMEFLAGVIAGVLSRERNAQHERDAAVEFSGIHALLAALEARDQYTGDHSRTVVTLARAVAQRLGMSEREILEVEHVALLHDIGKVGIPDSILLKRAALSEAEWELMRQHPAVGERIVANTQSLAHLAPAVRAEHERFDGRGYPDGLRGEQIPLASRITLACDAYDAMTTDRPYRKALSAAQARRELEVNSGSQFDPEVVSAMLEVLDSDAFEAPEQLSSQ